MFGVAGVSVGQYEVATRILQDPSKPNEKVRNFSI
jgi:hypothetical protein